MTDTGQIPGEGLPENAVGEAGLQPPAAHPGNGVPGGPDGLDGRQPDATGWPADQQTGQGAPGFDYLDHPAAPGPGIDDDDDVLLMPGPQGTWSDPQPVPSQPMPAQPVSAQLASAQPMPAQPMPAQQVPAQPVSRPVADAAHESGGRDSGSVDVSPVRAAETAEAGQPQQAAPAPRRPLHMGPPLPDATTGVSVRSLADRGPAHAQPQAPTPVRASGPPTIGPEYLDVPADDSTGIPVQQTGSSVDPAVTVPGSEWPAAPAASQGSLIPHADSVIPAQSAEPQAAFPAAPAQMVPIPVQAAPAVQASAPAVPGDAQHVAHPSAGAPGLAPGAPHTVGPPAAQAQVPPGPQPVTPVEPVPGSGTPAHGVLPGGAYGSQADQPAAGVGGRQVAGDPAQRVATSGSPDLGVRAVDGQATGAMHGAPAPGTPAHGVSVPGGVAGEQAAGTPAQGVTVAAGSPGVDAQPAGGRQVQGVPAGLTPGSATPAHAGGVAGEAAGQQVAGAPAHGVGVAGSPVADDQQVGGVQAESAGGAGPAAQDVAVAGPYGSHPSHDTGGTAGQQVGATPAHGVGVAGSPGSDGQAAQLAEGRHVAGVPAESVVPVPGTASAGDAARQQVAGDPAHGVNPAAGSPGVDTQPAGGRQVQGVPAGLTQGPATPAHAGGVAGDAAGQQVAVAQGVQPAGGPNHADVVAADQQAVGDGSASAPGTPAQGVSVPGSPGTIGQEAGPSDAGAAAGGQQEVGQVAELAQGAGTTAHGVGPAGAVAQAAEAAQAGAGAAESAAGSGTPAQGGRVGDPQVEQGEQSGQAAGPAGSVTPGADGSATDPTAGTSPSGQSPLPAGSEADAGQAATAPAHTGGAAPAARPPQASGGVRTRRRAVGLPQETAVPAGGGSPGAHAGRPEALPPAQEAAAAAPAGATLAHGVNLAGPALDNPPAPAEAPEVPGEARPAGPSVAFADEAAEREYGPAAEPYEPAVRDAVHRVIRERRDIRNGFRPDPIPHDVLLRVLEAAHTAPSVGHSQPWDFVIIRSEKTREKMHELAAQQREAYAKSLPKARARQFRELKIEAILDTPVNIVVTADPTRGGRHTLGRHTQPQMAPYSSALAVENLWLAARAEGLGVGWVSFFDERQMVTELGLPEHLEVVAYLCIGYVDEFPDEPELMQAGWSQRRPLSWVVHDEEYGNRALPGEEPHDLLEETLRGIRPLDAKALGEAWERQKRMTKPAGALGMLEIISAQLSGLSRKCPPPIPEPAALAIFAGDHGVHAQGVTSWPQEVTAQMVANFLGGGAVCNAFANQVGAEICVIDVGVASELPSTPGLLPRKVRAGTADFSVGPAMTREEALRAVEIGIETARDLVAAGNKALLTGEMGIANTTTSAALISVYTGVDPAEVTGRGTGINDEMHARKIDVVRRALDLHRPDPADPIGVLTAIGGLEHAAMVGLLLGAAALRTPVILDGVSAGAAALVARAIAPEVLAACIAGHRSAEPGHVAALTTLGLRPLVDLDLRLGEGTGALLALPLVQSAARVMHEVATFDAAGVTEKS